jgi:predicted ATPase
MRALPTGTVTMLFTDIEGSTTLLERLGDGYAEALAGHRRALREVFERHGGFEVGTEGDSFFVVFPAAAEALAAAREGQTALAEDEIRVRMGLHTGEPLIHDDDYVGMDVHRAARVGAAGHGGQILVTEATRALVDADDLTDLGAHRLKDIGEMRLFQVGDERFPPLRSMRAGNLSPRTKPLVGRDAEMRDVDALLRDGRARPVTLVGPGGIGKTTLAREVGRGLVDAFPDGVWFVDLAAVTAREQLEPEIASALSAMTDLAAHLGDRRALLILDNFEQLVAAGPEVARILEAAPNCGCLVTSREPLRIRGEREVPLSPLDVDASIELFRDRATAVTPAFDAEDATLLALCERLDRIPLAIELAAARTRVMDAGQLLARLETRLPMLTGGARDAPERQRTLRSTIEWSYDLLAPLEQRAFARLGVFLGGWTLDAAEDVCDVDVDTLERLAEKSLVIAERGRFRMLETIREFATERLDASEDAEAMRRRHAEHYRDLVARAEPKLTGPEQHRWLERLDTDLDNIRAAFEWLAARPERAEEAVRIAGDLTIFWYVRARHATGLEWLDRAVALSEGTRSAPRVRALWGYGFVLGLTGAGEEAHANLIAGLELATELGDASLTARCLDCLGLLAFFRNDLAGARAAFEDAISYAREADDRWCLADALATLGSIYPLVGDFEAATTAGREGLVLARREDDRAGIRMALFGLALAGYRSGDLDAARENGEEGLAICRELGDRFFVAYFLWILALAAVESDDGATARRHASESLEIAEELGVPVLLVCALEARAVVALSDDDDATAETMLRRADAIAGEGMVPGSYAAAVAFRLAELAASRNDRETANRELERSRALARDVGDVWGVARASGS